MQEVGRFIFIDDGHYDAYVYFWYTVAGSAKPTQSRSSSTLLEGGSISIDPADLGVPDGAVVTMSMKAVAGGTSDDTNKFLYRTGNPIAATFVSSGTTYIGRKLTLQPTNVWRNWAGNLTVTASAIDGFESVDDLSAFLQSSPTTPVRVTGTRHSGSPLVPTSGTIIDPSGITGPNQAKAVRFVDANGQYRVQIWPSATWGDVRDALTDTGNTAPLMYLPTAGVLPSINALGFISVAGHGTGWDQPTVADLVVSVDIVDASGTLHTYTKGGSPDVGVVVANLGLLGVTVSATLAVVPMFNLYDQEIAFGQSDVFGPRPAADGSGVDSSKLAALVLGNHYTDLFWFPWSGSTATGPDALGDGVVWAKISSVTSDPVRDVPGQVSGLGYALGQKGMEIVAAAPGDGTPGPIVGETERLAWSILAGDISSVQQTDGFVGTAPMVFHYQDQAPASVDLEVAIPIPADASNPSGFNFDNVVRAWYGVVDYVQAAYLEKQYPLTITMHARFTAGSACVVSPAYATDDTHFCWLEVVSAYATAETDPGKIATDIAPFNQLANFVGTTWIDQYGGMPHWGKYWQTIQGFDWTKHIPAARLAPFNAVRKTMDPAGTFMNPALEQTGLFT